MALRLTRSNLTLEELKLNKPTIKIIRYTIGPCHQFYFNLSREEADARWADYMAQRAPLENEYMQHMGYTVERSEFEATDEYWVGVMADEAQWIARKYQSMFAGQAS